MVFAFDAPDFRQESIQKLIDSYKVSMGQIDDLEGSTEQDNHLSEDQMGNEGAHGGSDIAFEFTNAARTSIDFIRQTEDPAFQKLKNILFDDILGKVKIFITEKPLYVGNRHIRQKSVAITFPLIHTIYINERAWKEISDLDIKSALALHELLVIAKIEKTGDYSYSERYLQERKKACDGTNCQKNSVFFCELIKKNNKTNAVIKIDNGRITSTPLGFQLLQLDEK